MLHRDSIRDIWTYEGVIKDNLKPFKFVNIKISRIIDQSNKNFLAIQFQDAPSNKMATQQHIEAAKEMLGLTAHEMRTPLNAALNFLELALTSIETP